MSDMVAYDRVSDEWKFLRHIAKDAASRRHTVLFCTRPIGKWRPKLHSTRSSANTTALDCGKVVRLIFYIKNGALKFHNFKTHPLNARSVIVRLFYKEAPILSARFK